MSGRKCSTIDFDQERAGRQRLLNQMDNYKSDIEGVRRQIVEALGGTTQGVKERFAADAERAEHWIELVDRMNSSPSLSLSSSLLELSKRLNQFQTTASEGLALQNRLQDAFINEAGHLRAEGARQIFEADSLLSRGDEMLRLWFGSEEVENFQAKLSRLRQELEADQLEQVAQLAASLNADLAVKLQLAQSNEAKHQSRLYVLKALRQVSAEMGFREVRPPFSDPPGERKSRIVLTVDTFNRGEVSFYLSLESIEANSCISQAHCFEEFNQLSKQLAETFGVITKFKMNEEPPQKSIRKGELEEPNGEELAM